MAFQRIRVVWGPCPLSRTSFLIFKFIPSNFENTLSATLAICYKLGLEIYFPMLCEAKNDIEKPYKIVKMENLIKNCVLVVFDIGERYILSYLGKKNAFFWHTFFSFVNAFFIYPEILTNIIFCYYMVFEGIVCVCMRKKNRSLNQIVSHNLNQNMSDWVPGKVTFRLISKYFYSLILKSLFQIFPNIR